MITDTLELDVTLTCPSHPVQKKRRHHAQSSSHSLVFVSGSRSVCLVGAQCAIHKVGHQALSILDETWLGEILNKCFRCVHLLLVKERTFAQHVRDLFGNFDVFDLETRSHTQSRCTW